MAAANVKTTAIAENDFSNIPRYSGNITCEVTTLETSDVKFYLGLCIPKILK